MEKYFSAEFVNNMNAKINSVLNGVPQAKVKVYATMGLNEAEGLLFDVAREIGAFPQVKSQRGKGGGMYVGEIVKG